jgi:DUF1680 family protein
MRNRKSIPIGLTLFILILMTSNCQKDVPETMDLIQAVDFSQVKINDRFWASRLKTHATVTLNACIDQCQNQTARISNFEKAAGIKTGAHEGIFFDDSDVYKAMEGIAYSLVNNPNENLEQLMDHWIDLIAASQEADGYINTYYSLTGLDQRWTKMDMHEMYCGGHMIEAAVAYYKVTGKRKFLDVALRFADHIDMVFGPGKRHWVPGHEEIELALVKLFQVTGDKRYLNLAHWLLEERGHGHGVGSYWEREDWGARYCQDDIPVKDISDIAGHAVRAMYLFTGMADVAAVTGDTAYIAALHRVWDDVVLRNMYIIGGIGSSHTNEGFTEDYDLPNESAYCETCASVGMVLWNQRMFQFTGNAKYIDVLERSMYNGALAGISLSGDRFFYVNPLASDGNHHRQAWYGCACCPSQISRFLPSIGNYMYGVSQQTVWVNLFVGSTATIPVKGTVVTMIQETGYPWDGTITITMQPEKPAQLVLKLRIPGWCDDYHVQLNNNLVMSDLSLNKGYLTIDRKWTPGDEVNLVLEMPVKIVASDPRVEANVGKRAVQRGPLVYCVEEIDNTNTAWHRMDLEAGTQFDLQPCEGILRDLTAIRCYSESSAITMIPYFAWDNREAGRMKVWLDYQE